MPYTVSYHPNPKYFISWGAGVQSTTLGVMSALGDIRKVEAILFADLGLESELTYKSVEFYTKFYEEHGIKVVRFTRGKIVDNLKDIPFHKSDGGMWKRQCTSNLKIEPIYVEIRRLLGLRLDGAGRTKKRTAVLYLGISYDEFHRAKDSRSEWVAYEYPFIDLKMTRDDCIKYLLEKKLPIPPKSSCLICPYRGKESWMQTTKNDIKQVLRYDKKIRNLYSDFECFINSKKLPMKQYLKMLINSKEEKEKPIDECEEGFCWI